MASPIRRPRFAANAAAIAALAAVALSLNGCKKPVDPYAEEPPKIGTLGNPHHDPVPNSADDPAQIHLLVQRLEFPGAAHLDDAAKLLDTGLIDAITAERWRANGLRLATLQIDRAPEFAKALPAITAQGMMQIAAGTRADFLRNAPPLDKPMTIQVTAHTSELEPANLPAGQPQWQVEAPEKSATPSRDGLAFRITPLHHFVKSSPFPRDPRDVAYDGLLLARLTASIRLPPGQALVIWWDRPDVLPFSPEPVYTTMPAEDLVDAPSTQPAAEGDAGPSLVSQQAKTLPPGTVVTVVPSRKQTADAAATQPAEPTGPKRPPLFGDLLMLSQRYGKAYQSMLIISAPSAAAESKAK